MCGVSSIYKDNCIEDAATVVARAVSDGIATRRDTIGRIKVST